MKFLFLLAVYGAVAVFGEAPSSGYPARGWRPKGPAFELPTEVGAQEPVQQFGGPDANAEVEVTEEEVQYTGEVTTTEPVPQFSSVYGPPGEEPSDDQDATPAPDDDDLTVQGIPSTEPAQEFRAFPTNQRFTSRKNQFNAQSVQFVQFDPRPAKFRQFPQQQNQFQRQRVATFTSNVQPNPRQQFGSRLQTFSGPTASGGFTQGFNQQFGRLTAAPVRNQRTRPFAPTFQRQEVVDSFGEPTRGYGPPAEPASSYGAPNGPADSYGPPGQDNVDTQETLEPVMEPEQESDVVGTTEENDTSDDDANPNIAISNSVANAKFRSQRYRDPKSARLQQLRQPIFTYDQSGRLVRIF